MQPSTSVVVQFQPRSGSERDRCVHCGSPLVDVPAYPRRGRKRACLAGWSAPRQPGALACGAPRWADRAA
jgi:ribosomal protein L34E